MIANKNEAKRMAKYITCDCKCKFNSTTCNLNSNVIAKRQFECKYYRKCKKDFSWNPRHVFVRVVSI